MKFLFLALLFLTVLTTFTQSIMSQEALQERLLKRTGLKQRAVGRQFDQRSGNTGRFPGKRNQKGNAMGNTFGPRGGNLNGGNRLNDNIRIRPQQKRHQMLQMNGGRNPLGKKQVNPMMF